jgi:hypothetical protein
MTMEVILAVLLLVVHFAFLYRIWTEMGLLWALGCLVIPFLTWLVAFMNWRVFRGFFLAELALAVVYFFLVR